MGKKDRERIGRIRAGTLSPYRAELHQPKGSESWTCEHGGRATVQDGQLLITCPCQLETKVEAGYFYYRPAHPDNPYRWERTPYPSGGDEDDIAD
jgi:hypothetical protein